ncbi:hypothetical protein QBC47DRAFT_430404 [Echria macrotheca]|uniref:Uncharacterized protein n=1 Tax=Echria macrotheca TaxID=438768 RepID=A0AAJ0B8T6_9PEZI|nr:hypothetical protein QBC47DRAFT_430404 [Echria macrotheca]
MVDFLAVVVSIMGDGRNMTIAERFQIMAAPHGPGVLAFWMLRTISLAISWAFSSPAVVARHDRGIGYEREVFSTLLLPLVLVMILNLRETAIVVHQDRESYRNLHESNCESALAVCDEMIAWLGVLYWVATKKRNTARRLTVVGIGLVYVLAQCLVVWSLQVDEGAFISPNRSLLQFQIVALAVFVVGWYTVAGTLCVLDASLAFFNNNAPSPTVLWSVMSSVKRARERMQQEFAAAVGITSIWLRYGPLSVLDMYQAVAAILGVHSLLTCLSGALRVMKEWYPLKDRKGVDEQQERTTAEGAV